jgi:transcriptional regulator of met regulon
MKRPPQNPVTPEAREAFWLYVRAWQERLGMQDWRIVVSSKPATSDAAAMVSTCDVESRLAVIRLGTDFRSEEVTDETLEDTAAHELCHIFLHAFKLACQDPRTDHATIMSEEHRIVHTLVNMLVHGR